MDTEDMAWGMAVVEATGMAAILAVKEIDRLFDALDLSVHWII
jgi:hypothetical protein